MPSIRKNYARFFLFRYTHTRISHDTALFQRLNYSLHHNCSHACACLARSTAGQCREARDPCCGTCQTRIIVLQDLVRVVSPDARENDAGGTACEETPVVEP